MERKGNDAIISLVIPTELLQHVEYEDVGAGTEIAFEAYLDGRRVGFVAGEGVGDQIDIHIELDDPRYRGRGIGTELLRRFLAKADACGIREIRGYVFDTDLEDSPFLLEWYANHGFIAGRPREYGGATVRDIFRIHDPLE